MSGVKSFACVIFCLTFCFSCNRERPATGNNRAVSDETTIEEGPSEVHIIEIKQMKFQPAEILVKKGDSVRWINKDITNHDVTEQSSQAWASSPLATGESWSMVATETVDYYCNLHQVMKGKIIVE